MRNAQYFNAKCINAQCAILNVYVAYLTQIMTCKDVSRACGRSTWQFAVGLNYIFKWAEYEQMI